MDQQQARLWLAIVLSMLVWVAYDHYVLAPAREAAEQAEVVAADDGGMPDPAAPAAEAPAPADVAERRMNGGMPADADHVASSGLRAAPAGTAVTVDTPLYRAVVTPRGGRLVSLELKRYRTTVQRDSPPLNLVKAGEGSILPLTMWVGSGVQDGDTNYEINQTAFDITAGETAALVMNAKLPSGGSIRKTIEVDGDTYVMKVTAAVKGIEAPTTMSLVVPSLPETGGYSNTGDQAVGIAGGKLVEHSSEAMSEKASSVAGVDWAGFSQTYFAGVGIPFETSATAIFGSVGDDPVVRLDVAPRDGSASFLVLLGPKDRELLESYGHGLSRLVDFGWFWFIATPLLWLVHRIHDLVSNYGIAIVVVTIILKLVTFPLNQASMRSMRKMQEIQPHMQKLRERHKEDPAAMQREMMELYKKHKVNPFSGCVPVLVQIPVFIGLYNGLLRDIALRHAPFVGWINDLSAPDRLQVAGLGIPVLTLLMGASMLLQQITAPAQGDPTQRRMMMIMPVVFTFMFINFPSGLVLYWLVNNVISIGQQYLAMRPTT